MLRQVFSVAFLCFFTISGTAYPAVISPDLQAKLSEIKAGECLPVLIFFKQGVDLSRYDGGRATAGELIMALREDARRSQAGVLDFLRIKGMGDGVKSFWINNSIALEATRSIIESLSAFEAVARIKFDDAVRIPEPVNQCRDRIAGDRDTRWNIEIIRADEVWDTFGLSGDGILFGLMDSGAEIDHPALEGKWRGGSNSWYDLINGLPDPYDDHGHGTRVTAVLVGGDGPGPFTEDVGIAYNAKFIAAKIFNQDGGGATESVVTDAAQWLLDPDGNPGTSDFPHITSNSWLLQSYTETFFHPIAAAWRAAGIIPVCAVGNSGPAAETTFPPGNYNNTIGVGATTASDRPWGSSSRGPSPDGWAFPADRRKPDVATPGEAVYSAGLNGTYGTFNGTSMATPHTAATVALMLEADPSLTFDEIYAKLTGSAVDLDPAGYDHASGHGRVDAFRAAERALGVDFIVTGPGPGPGNPPLVRTFDPLTVAYMEAEWSAYGPQKYGVNVACGHVALDGLDEVITGPGPGRIFGPHVRVFDGYGTPVYWAGFIAYGTRKFGVNVAAGDIDGDGYDEIVTGPGPGAVFGPHVRGWDLDGSPPVASIGGVNFMAYGTRKYGVNVTCGDIDGDGFDEILTGPGPGRMFGGHVRGWNYDGSGQTSAMWKVNYQSSGSESWGVNVACGDLDGDGYDEILTGPGPNPAASAHVRGWNYDNDAITSMSMVNFIAYYGLRYGVVVGAANLDADEYDEILTMPGPGPDNPPEARGWNYDGGSLGSASGFNAYEGMGLGYGGKIAGGNIY